MLERTKRIMSGSEIARDYDISRQAVSQILKSAFRKMYNNAINSGVADTPYDAALAIMYILRVNEGDENDIQEFYELFPPDIKREILADVKKPKKP